MEKPDCYTHGESRTKIGQLVKFSCPIPDRANNEERKKITESIREFLSTQIRDIDIPTTGRVNIGHGGYGRYTRYDITQHKYAGGGYPGCGGYIEVLEIKNPPDGRWNIVIYENIDDSSSRGSSLGSSFTEWETLENALDAFAKYWCSNKTEMGFAALPGFKRRIKCGALTPWFYAIGDEELIGDYAFPEGLQDDPVFRVGKQFVVFGHDGIPIIKTCMGTRFLQGKERDYPHKEYHFRLIYWDDGSVCDQSRGDALPRSAEENEFWITEAVHQFRQLLAGQKTEFTINFTDGNRFIGKLTTPKHRTPCAEGDYFMIVNVKGEQKPRQGWVNDFAPTKETPDIIQYVTQKLAQGGKEAERIEVKESKIKKGGKKWVGVFLSPLKT